MREFVSKERRAANAPLLHYVKRLYWFDLTAGDGYAAHDAPWADACSPGILASEAAKSNKPVIVDLYEKDPDTYKALLENLAAHLPGLGYRQVAANQWSCGNARVRVANLDGRSAYIEHVEPHDVVLVLNDPNIVDDWAMDRRFLARLEGRSKGARALSALGFNVNGRKRGPLEAGAPSNVVSMGTRSEWYRLIEDITRTLPRRHDLMLAKFKRDQAQWAYLFSSPWDSEEEEMVKVAFTITNEPHDYEFAWFRKTPDRFARLIDELILTKTELRALTQPVLPLGESAGEGGAM